MKADVMITAYSILPTTSDIGLASEFLASMQLTSSMSDLLDWTFQGSL